ncbi:hypothetical protein L6164_013471 [Bauhinia variegata]|uniref:Uncharacterized protein n=1 Tax=Bauhinia variegata TaxID=167791 RepID=A0ACB9NGA9_BAUVA|nr:hypothetical protein L6164_013471 [Bauhinia variegata]
MSKKLFFRQNLTDPLNRLQYWSDNRDCCTWKVVVCRNVSGQVLELHLRSFRPPFRLFSSTYYKQDEAYKKSRLGGDISHSLLDLKHLNHLDLSCNDFGGMPIPSCSKI